MLPPWRGTPKAKEGLCCSAVPKEGSAPCRPSVAPLLWGRGGAARGYGAQGAPGLLCGVQNPRAKGSCELSPHSLLCGCWAQPLGLVKQQDRSRLGKRGTGESLNKEFLIWSRFGRGARFLPQPAVLGSASLTSARQPHPWGASPLALPQQLLRAPVLGLRAPLRGPGLSLCTYPSAVPWVSPGPCRGSARTAGNSLRAAALGVQTQKERFKGEPRSV